MPTFAELAQKPLPLLPNTVAQLRSLLSQPQTRTPALQEVMLKDPAATITVFRHLHRIKPGSTAEVADIAHAAAMIGFEAFKNLLKDLPMIAAANTDHLSVCQLYYGENAPAGRFAKAWAKARGLANPNAPATAAVMQNPAALVLAAHDPESAARAIGAVRDGVPAATAYRAEMGTDYPTANRDLASTWGYSKLAAQASAGATRSGSPTDLVTLAVDLARSTAADWRSPENASLITELAGLLQLTEDQAAAQLRQQAVEAARDLHSWGFPANAFSLLQIGRDDYLDIAELERAERILKRLERPVTEPSSNPLQVALTRTLNNILQDAGVRRVMLAMLSRDRARLSARLTLGSDLEDPLSSLDLPMNRRHLFAMLMSKSQSLWVNASNREKYRALCPEELQSLLGETEFFAMSLVVEGQPLGMLYADGQKLDDQGYATFRRHCQTAINELTRHRKAA